MGDESKHLNEKDVGDESKNLNEKDAAPTGVTSSAEDNNRIVRASEQAIEEIFTPGNNPQTVNNNMMLSQRNVSSMMTFNGCNGITLGTVVNVGWSPGRLRAANRTVKALAKEDESVYRKTPTIKVMLESTDPITLAFLDCVSEYFGSRYREVTILLDINKLFVDRMYEDFFDKGGTKEVIFQILSKYFKDHPSEATVGWLTTFLWNNRFRQTVFAVKESYKELKRLENEFD